MSKIKRIRKLEASEDPKDKEKADALRRELEAEERRIKIYLTVLTTNKLKREQAYINRKQIKASERESCRQRKIRLNKERRAKLSA